jgi:NDP-sugar pyrophosphorylase family protein
MQIAILAGGLATRLGNITKDCPKSMIRIEGKPFLEYQLGFLKREGVENVVLCVGHLGEQIESYFGDGGHYGVNIRYSHEEKPLGTAGALKIAESLLEDAFFTIYGDSFVSMDFTRAMSFFNTQNKLALMTVYKNYNRFDKSNTEIEGNLVTRFSKKEKTDKTIYVEHGVNIFRKQVLNMIPANECYSLDDLFPCLIEQQELLAFEVNERFYEIGSLQGLNEFESLVGGGVK